LKRVLKSTIFSEQIYFLQAKVMPRALLSYRWFSVSDVV